MKASKGKQWQRRARALLALLTHGLARGPVEIGPFAEKLAQLGKDRVIANPANYEVLKGSPVTFDRLLKKKRAERTFVRFVGLYKRHTQRAKRPPDEAHLTLGDIVKCWTALTGQDETEFASRIGSKLERLAIKHSQATGQLGFTDDHVTEHPEVASSFVAEVFSMLVRETPPDKLNLMYERTANSLLSASTQSEALSDNGLLHGASIMLTSEAAAKISQSLQANPIAGERILHPLMAALIKMEADKYGWGNDISANCEAQLHSSLKEKGIHAGRRALLHALRSLARRSITQNIDSALEDRLEQEVGQTIKDQQVFDQDRTQTIWECPPVSPEDEAQTKGRVREWLFRRNSDAGRNH